ncbi:endo-1,3(4)-beta-glucanase [Ascoidea rubescens DSM 1968]|uniref:glucan endo-1,3-beta-D-glucosidase n=1 Tax=Ascoidea rubescens DSM 1968 TaxID=1344418 RepID=A0A1D2VFX6_9ASCO|nr:glycoside hydrolase family 81 protein [Ascoidea rubescens DSM 1968]ODV60536.1 glycoside hydrolase family 81 protein [Ascoidea rubescens DSM 1968]
MWFATYHNGFAISQTTSSQITFSNGDNDSTASYYTAPTNIGSVVFSATVFDENVSMDVTDLKDMSVLVTLFKDSLDNDETSDNFIDIPLVQGMGLISGTYNGNLITRLKSSIGFSTLVLESSTSLNSDTLKYKASLFDGVDWLIYVTFPESSLDSMDEYSLQVENNYVIEGNLAIDGLLIQVAVSPDDSSLETYYDQAAGIYTTSAYITGSASCNSATYAINYVTEGSSISGSTMVFALPHHLVSLSGSTSQFATGISLDSTTKGKMYGFLSNSLIMNEDITDVKRINFLPINSTSKGEIEYTEKQLQLLGEVINEELSVDISGALNGLNTYYIGKIIDKYAYILLVIESIVQDQEMSESTLIRMKETFDIILKNEQLYALIYDTKFGGITSSGALDNYADSTGFDFGASFYNDHHFHYGYIIHAAAIIGFVDYKVYGENSTWVSDNKDYINSLIRDVSNSNRDDEYFPFSRSFDWFQGHSWASGLYSSGSGKNEESTSEDYHYYYGMKLWGKVTGDGSLENRGNLILSIMSKSINLYFLYSSENTVQPSKIIENKVAGILFDQKIDYTTYFGTNTEYIHGIHMLPITPISSIIRKENFVGEEWDSKLGGIIDSVESGWTGILRLNQALVNPQESYEFFSQEGFDSAKYLDNGQSRTWALAFSGALANL